MMKGIKINKLVVKMNSLGHLLSPPWVIMKSTSLQLSELVQPTCNFHYCLSINFNNYDCLGLQILSCLS